MTSIETATDRKDILRVICHELYQDDYKKMLKMLEERLKGNGNEEIFKKVRADIKIIEEELGLNDWNRNAD